MNGFLWEKMRIPLGKGTDIFGSNEIYKKKQSVGEQKAGYRQSESHI